MTLSNSDTINYSKALKAIIIFFSLCNLALLSTMAAKLQDIRLATVAYEPLSAKQTFGKTFAKTKKSSNFYYVIYARYLTPHTQYTSQTS